jgi:hypothetical protein
MKQASQTSQMRVADSCRRTADYRTALEKEGILQYISTLDFFKATPRSLTVKTCDRMSTEEYKAGETCKP